MPAIKYTGYWAREFQRDVPRGIPAIKPLDVFIKQLAAFFNRMEKAQEKKGELRELEIRIEYHCRKRNLDQNALMWALYEIEAYEQNRGMIGAQAIRKEDLYRADMLEYAPRAMIEIAPAAHDWVKSEYLVMREELIDEKWRMECLITSSKWNILQMSTHIEMMFGRLAEAGVNESGDIIKYWQEFQQHKSDKKIMLHLDAKTEAAYKAATPSCEACGAYIGTGGSLAHIVARGMGGHAEASKQTPENWLHLDDTCHSEFDNGRGVAAFIKKYPHLKYKIENATKRNYAV